MLDKPGRFGRRSSARFRGSMPENCALLAEFSEPSFPMTNEKFPMTDFPFMLSALVVALPRYAATGLRSKWLKKGEPVSSM
jgi:hypothetical protein